MIYEMREQIQLDTMHRTGECGLKGEAGVGSECTKWVIIARDGSKRGVYQFHLCTKTHFCTCDGNGGEKNPGCLVFLASQPNDHVIRYEII